MTIFNRVPLMLAGASALLAATPANAGLTLFQQFSGKVGLSTDGGGSTANGYGVSAFVPFGATVIAAYLYQSNSVVLGNQSVTLNGSALSFSSNSVNTGAGGNNLSSSRADVTSIAAALINGGIGGTYNFTVGEGNSAVTDGTALVVVYSLDSLATQTVAILDGFASTGGDTAVLTLGAATTATFAAEMRLGIGFSCCTQASTVAVNGITITNNAGNFDDGVSGPNNGALITVGGDDDPFSGLLPTYANDHERYNIAPQVALGSTSITVRTNNPSNDDNIFLAAFVVSGTANVTTGGVPEPATWAMLLLGFGGMGYAMRRRPKISARIRFA